ncbi:peptide chain release factor 1-like, mitochondrial isoform X3 [Tupaia chinensis]|uniref:peptide chain release factor 1-like, mitochondrial isoform X3 n=1 Tax=Tupaia chinensis TaxID=246437 RepID=UPI000FFB894C|nr:peptide chain release factor 1-like, mitochondrial isoform X3 [Tupaia chinensis]
MWCRETCFTPELPVPRLGVFCLAMRARLLWGAARCLWARQAVGPARRPISYGSTPLEELFTRGGPLRTFLERQIVLLLVPSEETDENDLILEVTAGVGGQEAMLFTSEIFDMYQQYAAFKRWNFETLEYFPSEIGGLRHASASIGGSEAYKHMKFEGGVHRVQRVPKTEKQGRIHTSTMTVAILPQPTEINLVINPKDLRIDTKRASGAGGQHVNTTDSAVRIVHLPTGVVSECQQERSQLKNREMAMKKLRAKLYSMQLEEETSKRYNARKIQIGTRGRSEKIRTYNFPQNRVTDHRINKSLHDLETFMQGDYLLDELVQSLKDYANYESLVEIISKNVYCVL